MAVWEIKCSAWERGQWCQTFNFSISYSCVSRYAGSPTHTSKKGKTQLALKSQAEPYRPHLRSCKLRAKKKKKQQEATERAALHIPHFSLIRSKHGINKPEGNWQLNKAAWNKHPREKGERKEQASCSARHAWKTNSRYFKFRLIQM